MPLAISASLGPYQIVAPLGSGGMGDVYRARDTRLNRSVAIKVLREHLAGDSERRMRFEREAHVLSQLNHPHICTLFDVGEHEGITYLVLELVDGETLTERLARSRVPHLSLNDALTIATEIAQALAAAHRQGIVHRDLKPSNVMLTKSGVKLLDFGIAKAKDAPFPSVIRPDARDGAALRTVTVEGTILGTIHYMAPEQLEGLDADARSDIFSFGAVLYEMLTGERAFDGESQSKVIAAVLDHDPPPVSSLQPLTPPALARIIQKSLAKDPEKRWQSASDLADELKWVRDAGNDGLAVTTAPRSFRRRVMPVALGVLLTGVLTGAAWWGLRSEGSPKTVSRFTVPLGEGQRFALPVHQLVALSPDGTQLVYAADTGLYVRSMAELTAKPLSPMDAQAAGGSPVFSPDGRWVVFYSGWGESLKKVAVTGGAAVTLCAAGIPFGISWSDSGILFGQGYPGSEPRGILRISPDGGKPELLIASKNDEVAATPQMLPDGDTLLFTLLIGDSQDRWDRASIVAQSLKSGKRTTLIEGGSDGRYVTSGHLLYARGGVVYAVPFDARHVRVTGGPVPMLEGVHRSGANGTASWSLADNGTLLYARGPAPSTDHRGLALSNREGVVEALKIAPGPYLGPRVSPDGKWIAVTLDDGKESNIWLYDVTGATSGRRLTYGGKNRFAAWSPDGRRLVYQSDREGDQGLFWQLADGTGIVERLTRAEPQTFHVAESFSRDGEHVLVRVTTPSKRFVLALSITDKTTAPFLDEGGFSTFSPDGRWVAYTHREGRLFPVNVAPFPPTGATYQIWADGTQSAWSPDGEELYAIAHGSFEAVHISSQPTIAFGPPHSVPFLGYGIGPLVKNYDVLPDGRFLILTNPTGRDAIPQIEVVLNWVDELKRRVIER